MKDIGIKPIVTSTIFGALVAWALLLVWSIDAVQSPDIVSVTVARTIFFSIFFLSFWLVYQGAKAEGGIKQAFSQMEGAEYLTLALMATPVFMIVFSWILSAESFINVLYFHYPVAIAIMLAYIGMRNLKLRKNLLSKAFIFQSAAILFAITYVAVWKVMW